MPREMKDSGIEWIGEIPRTWATDRLQWHLEEVKVSNSPIQSEQILSLTIEAGVIPYEEKGNQGNKSKENYEEYKLAYPNTLVVNSMNVIIGAIGISKYFGCVSPVYYVFKATPNTDLRYIYYLFTNVGFQKEMRKYAKGILEIRLRISAEDMLKRIIPKPPFEEQKAIADFLDKQCAEIDAVIAKTKATIEEYKKLKQSIITEAVTKGIRGDRPMKDSGIEWIGEIPADWDVVRIKTLFDYRNERNEKPLEEVNLISLYTDLGVVQHCDLESTTGNKATNADGYKLVYENDIVVNIILCWMGAIGRSAYTGVTSPAYDVYSPREGTNSKFYHHLFRTQGFSGDCYKVGRGIMAMRWRTYSDQFRAIKVVAPPKEEQEEIIEYLDQKCVEIDALVTKKEQIVVELESYKKSLIYEVVTGKREV